LPKDLEQVKPEILERQRLHRELFKEINTPSSAQEVAATEKQEEE
jgi:hypothetical protein